MIREYATMEEWLQAYLKAGGQQSPGLSPGGAAAVLGYSREMIFKLIRQGKLDVVRIRGKGRSKMLLVDEESIRSYARERKLRAGYDVRYRRHAG